MTSDVWSRNVVLDILIEVMEKGAYSHIVLRQALDKYGYLDKKERAFITRLSNGTIERTIELDYIINQFSNTKIEKMKPVIRNILRMTVYQLKYMNTIPVSAACNEAVKLAGKRGFTNLKGFVNGVCRNISRNLKNIEPYPTLGIKYSMPEWIIEEWQREYDNSVIVKILESFFDESSNKRTTVRCNISKKSVEAIIEELQSQNITVEKDEYLPYALHISNYDCLENVNAFNEGLIQVQDISSMLVGQIANPKKGDYCIDVCAAPGGKSIHLADMLGGTGTVDSRDLTYEKVALIEENINRSGFNNIVATVKDGTVADKESKNKADIIVADLPCSGLGIIGNKVDIKYKMTPQKQREIIDLQREILSNIQSYGKNNTTFIYSTCTINSKENIENVRWFTEKYPYKLVSIDDCICKQLRSETTKLGYIQLLPGVYKMAGFFIAKLKRVE